VRWAARTGRPVEELDALMQAADFSMKLKQDTLAWMDELDKQGVNLYCLSNMPAERYAYLRQSFDFWHKFKGIVISAHVNMVKPEPQIFAHLLDAYELDPDATLFVDDSPDNIAASHSVGIQGLLFTTARDCRKQYESLNNPAGQ
jgi:putative hydrolase of the HAD superfamily